MKSCILQETAQLFHGVGVLLVVFPVPAPAAVLLPEEQVQSVAAYAAAGIVVRPPDAEQAVVLVQIGLAVRAFQGGGSLDIEQEQPAGGQGPIYPRESPAQGGGAGDVVYAVQAGDHRVRLPRQGQPGHILTQEPHAQPPALLLGQGQHVGGEVHGGDGVAPLGQQQGEAACAAAQLRHRANGPPRFPELPLHIVRPFFIAHVRREPVVGRGEGGIGVRHPFNLGRTVL